MLPLQCALLPTLLRFVARGERLGVARDVVCAAPTGAGKTLCYAIPVLDYLLRHVAHGSPRAVIVTPSKDLAEQVERTLRALLLGDASVRIVALFGAAKRNAQREAALVADAHLLVTTPTRWLDHIDGALAAAGADAAARIKFFVVDEADKLVANAPFVHRHAAALALPPADDYFAARPALFTCRWLFSATLTRDETELEHIFALRHAFVYCRAELALPDSLAFDHLVVASPAHRLSLLKRILADHAADRVVVFVNSVDACQHLYDELASALGADHVSQYSSRESVQSRSAALHNFRVLVCTDAAARGLDIAGLPLVIHYEHPPLRATFVHRSGRTARAGAPGKAISLLFPNQVYFWKQWTQRAAAAATSGGGPPLTKPPVAAAAAE
jgi:superfamily II DNA/RNA helicase